MINKTPVLYLLTEITDHRNRLSTRTELGYSARYLTSAEFRRVNHQTERDVFPLKPLKGI